MKELGAAMSRNFQENHEFSRGEIVTVGRIP
jgi:hypothetical protein